MKHGFRALLLLGTAGLAAFAVSRSMAGARPPGGAMALSEVIRMIEQHGYSPISEVEMEHGVWEIEAYKNNSERKLKVDPFTGRILSDRPDD